MLVACKKKEDNLILPGQVDGTANPKTDSMSIVSYTIPDDSFITSTLPYQLLGVMNDPNMGVSAAKPYSELTITNLNPDFNQMGSNFTVDSAVLTIRYTSTSAYYGDLSTAQTINVFKLTDAFPANADIYSSESLAFETAPIGTYNGTFNLNDSVFIQSGNAQVKIAPSLKIKLTSAFANELFSAPAGTYKDDASFKSFLKGIVLSSSSSPTSGDGGIVALTLDDPLSQITLYYHNANDTNEYNLSMESSRNFANYEIRNQSSSITNQFANPGTDFPTNYLQSMTGSKVAVELNGLNDLYDISSQIIIHKAELIVNPQAGSFNSSYPLPQRLLVLQPDDNGQSIAIPDLFTGKFDGNLRADNSYALNVTEFIQFQINQGRNQQTVRNILHIVIPNRNPIAPSRMILDANKGTYKMALSVVYSEL